MDIVQRLRCVLKGNQDAQAAADEIERLRDALMRVQNFPSHPGGHPDDRSADADDPASWRHGWICAVEAMQDHALPNAGIHRPRSGPVE